MKRLDTLGRGRAVALVLAAVCLQPSCGGPEPGNSLPGSEADAPPWFVEEAKSRGLTFRHHSGHQEQHLFPEIVGGGAALFDMDGDGDLDAYLVQSGSLHRGTTRTTNRLFENHGRGYFKDVTAESGAADAGYGMGVTAGDYDGDGRIDLYVTNYGPNVLLRNLGGGKFRDVTGDAGVGDPGWGTSAASLDYDTDGNLDLFVVNYINWSEDRKLTCHMRGGLADYCSPTSFASPAMDRLYRGRGDGTFEDVSRPAGLDAGFGNGLGVAVADFDGDSRLDIFVANDQTPDQLWMNQGDGTFLDEAMLRGCAVDFSGKAKAGMGVAMNDYDNDADADLLIVNLYAESDSFFSNDAGFFTDLTGAVGLGQVGRTRTRFGVGLADFDNDGYLDVYQANGRVERTVQPVAGDPYAEPNLLFRGDSTGRFTEVRPPGGTAPPLVATSRAAAFGDVDDDGGIDILVINRDAEATLLHNVVERRGHWVRFRVLDESGREALGAFVSVSVNGRVLRRMVTVAYSYLAANDSRVHFGVGDETTVTDVRVRWVDGGSESFGSFSAGRTHTLRRTPQP